MLAVRWIHSAQVAEPSAMIAASTTRESECRSVSSVSEGGFALVCAGVPDDLSRLSPSVCRKSKSVDQTASRPELKPVGRKRNKDRTMTHI